MQPKRKNKIDCNQNVKTKLIVTQNVGIKIVFAPLLESKERKRDKENSSIYFPYLACIKIKLFATSRKQFYLMSS